MSLTKHSGKSSLLATLLRCLDLNSGSVIIDEQDISRISRDALRKRIMVLPQKPLFIHDSIRANMVLWEDNSSRNAEEIDAQIELFLRKVGIWDAIFARGPSASDSAPSSSSSSTRVPFTSSTTDVTDIPPPLDTPEEEKPKSKSKAKKSKSKPKAETPNPSSPEPVIPTTLSTPLDAPSLLSAGQQQLFCLARALFQHNDPNNEARIVLVDEFTSNMDHETETVVRETVARELAGRTVVEVLHRLEHILEFDLVVVLERGRVVEVGHPEELLAVEGGVLGGLYRSVRG